MHSAVADINPELTSTKNLKIKVADLERTVKVLKEENASELSTQVL